MKNGSPQVECVRKAVFRRRSNNTFGKLTGAVKAFYESDNVESLAFGAHPLDFHITLDYKSIVLFISLQPQIVAMSGKSKLASRHWVMPPELAPQGSHLQIRSFPERSVSHIAPFPDPRPAWPRY